MTKTQKAHLKTFVENEETFEIVKSYLLDLKEPPLVEGMTICDFGAIVHTHRGLVKALSQRFDSMKIDATSDEA